MLRAIAFSDTVSAPPSRSWSMAAALISVTIWRRYRSRRVGSCSGIGRHLISHYGLTRYDMAMHSYGH